MLAQGTDAASVLPLIEAERVTWICAVPAMAVMWLNDPSLKHTDFSSLRSFAVGGSRLNPETARRVLDEIGPVVTQVYGMSEGLCCATSRSDPDEVIIETQGRPVSEADEFRIVDEYDREVLPGEPGELLTRGPYTSAAITALKKLIRTVSLRTASIALAILCGSIRAATLSSRGGART